MNTMSEATTDGNNIRLNGWFRVILGIITTMVFATTAYAFIIILPTMSNHIIQNDKDSRMRDSKIKEMVTENRILIAEIINIKEDMEEIKGILRRTAPYERKDSF